MTQTSTAEPRRRRRSKVKIVRTLISIAVVAVGWELLGRHIVLSNLIFASLSEIFLRVIELAQSGDLWKHVRTSGLAFVLGYGMAVVIGIGIGVLLAISRRFADYMEPWLIALYATPMIALAPVFIVLLGIGLTSKVVIIFIEAFFPIAVNTALGIRSTEADLVDMSRSFGATQQQVTRTVLLPNAYPFVIEGMRIAVARGLAGVLVAEIFGSVAGVGNMIWFSAEAYDMPTLFVGVFILAGTSIVLMTFLARLQRVAAPWRK